MIDLKKIIEIVKEKHGKSDFKYHIMAVVQNSTVLATKLDADIEIVEVAAYLHDIGRAGRGQDDSDHDILGEKMAREILDSLKISQDKIDKICQCILTHRGQKLRPQTIEAEIVANADAMAHIVNFLQLFAIYYKSQDIDHAIEQLTEKVEKDWNNKITLPLARDLINDEYRAVTLLLNRVQKYQSLEY